MLLFLNSRLAKGQKLHPITMVFIQFFVCSMICCSFTIRGKDRVHCLIVRLLDCCGSRNSGRLDNCRISECQGPATIKQFNHQAIIINPYTAGSSPFPINNSCTNCTNGHHKIPKRCCGGHTTFLSAFFATGLLPVCRFPACGLLPPR
jgi:hypothetical protein